MKIRLLIILLCFPLFMFAQGVAHKMGDKKYDKFKYAEAIDYYKYALKKDSSNSSVVRSLALCFEKVNDYKLASKYFSRLVVMESKEVSDILLFGYFLKKTGKYSLAIEQFQNYIKLTGDNEDVSIIISQIKMCEKYAAVKLMANIKNSKFNSSSSEFAPLFFKNDLIFTSARGNTKNTAHKYAWDNEKFLEIFKCNLSSGNVSLFDNNISSKYHEGTLSFTEDFKTMYFTRNNFSKGKVKRNIEGIANLKIFIASKTDNKWEITSEFEHNNDEYSVGHPSISKDGSVLYFVSDIPGGFGGTDIYYCAKKDTIWSEPVNMGAIVNTPGNEMFPFIFEDGLLFFSSDGQPGLGGLDIFAFDTAYADNILLRYGAPLNSAGDDFSLIMNMESKAYFASNREGGKGADDIYQLNMSAFNDIQLHFNDMATGQKIYPELLSVNNVKVIPVNMEDSVLSYVHKIRRQKKHRMIISLPGYLPVDTIMYSRLLEPIMNLNLNLERENQIIEIKNERLAVRLVNKQTGELIVPDVVQLIEPEVVDLKDNFKDGVLTVDLNPNQRYRLFIKKQGYFAIDTVFFTDGEGRALLNFGINKMNDLSESLEYLTEDFDNVLFDFDSFRISNKAKQIVNHVADHLLTHKNLILTLVARTDSRGSAVYNDNLAMKRALVVQEIFANIGVNINRVIVLALGETDPYLRNDKQSLEEWYQDNRSVDFKLNTLDIKSLEAFK